MINPPLASTAVGVVHHSRSGMASGINNTFRQVGIATGIAGLGAVFQHDVTRDTTAALASGAGRAVLHAAHGNSRARSSPAKSASSRSRCRTPPAPRSCTPIASASPKRFTSILVIAAAVALVGSVLAFALVRSRDFVSSGEPPSAGPARARRRRLTQAAARAAVVGALRDQTRPAEPAFRRIRPPALVARTAEHRQARIARISWILARAPAQREARSRACCAPPAGARTCRTARLAPAARRWRRPLGHAGKLRRAHGAYAVRGRRASACDNR